MMYQWRRGVLVFFMGVLIVAAAWTIVRAQDQIIVSGNNSFQLGRGTHIEGNVPAPNNYLQNITETYLGVKQFNLKLRFQVDQPSLGYEPNEPVYREFFSRRSLGLKAGPVKLDAGHFKTAIGRGLTLNLQEDLSIEKSNLLDGVYAESELSWSNIKAFAGRAIHRKSFRAIMQSDSAADTARKYVTDKGDTIRMPAYQRDVGRSGTGNLHS